MTGKRAPPRWPFSERVTRERVKTETVYSRETERSRALALELRLNCVVVLVTCCRELEDVRRRNRYVLILILCMLVFETLYAPWWQ